MARASFLTSRQGGGYLRQKTIVGSGPGSPAFVPFTSSEGTVSGASVPESRSARMCSSRRSSGWHGNRKRASRWRSGSGHT